MSILTQISNIKKWAGFICLLFINLTSFGQIDSTQQDSLSQSIEDEFLNIFTQDINSNPDGVVDKEVEGVIEKEVPSITSVITREDIEIYGAKDLSDILRLVPGFEFGIDVAGIIGTTYRGVNVHEGKQLLLVNGLTMNELAYGNTNNIGTMPASAIEKVEIIRGPGSVIYGGFAGLTVINVTTRDASLNGVELTAAGGLVGNGGSYLEGSISGGINTKEVKMAVNASYTDQALSTRTYSDFYGNTIAMSNQNFYRKWNNVFIKMESNGVSFKYNKTSFTFPGHDAFTDIVPIIDKPKEILNNIMNVVGIDYTYKFSPFISIKPYLEYSSGNAIASSIYANSQVTADFQTATGVRLKRYRAGVLSDFDFKKYGRFILGLNYYLDEANNIGVYGEDGLWATSGENTTAETTTQQQTRSLSGLLQYNNLITDYIGITAGIRVETTTFGNAYAPRLGLTFVKDKFSSKLLYGSAYRIPLPWQQYNRFLYTKPSPISLEPETSHTLELELGYKFNKYFSAKINTFYLAITDPIVFIVDKYINDGDIHSIGIEGELLAKYKNMGGFFNFSTAKPVSPTSTDFTTSNDKSFLGSPTLKTNFGAYYQASSHIKIAPSLTVLGVRYAQDGLNQQSKAYDPLGLLNLNLTYSNLINKLLDVSLYGSNLLSADYVLLQPYYGGHAPLPANDRRIVLSFTFHL